jgi:hypothetical protein
VREIWAVVKGIVGVVEEGGEEGVLEGGLQCLESLVGRCVGMGVYANEVERIGVEFIKVQRIILTVSMIQITSEMMMRTWISMMKMRTKMRRDIAMTRI